MSRRALHPLSYRGSCKATKHVHINLQIVNGDIQPNYHHKGYKKIANTTGVGGVQFLTDPVTQSDQWLADVKMVLRKVGLI